MTKPAALAATTLLVAGFLVNAQPQQCPVDKNYARGKGGASVGIFHPGKDVSAPEPICQSGLPCIATANGAREPDTVRLWVIVAPDGAARVPRVLQGVSTELDAWAMAVVESWPFRPGCWNGKSVWTDIPIDVPIRPH